MADGAITAVLSVRDREVARITLQRGDEGATIGRSRECTLRAPGDEHSVSGHHARLFWQRSALYIEDTGSRNGVFRLGRRVKSAYKVGPKDVFSLGDCSLAFHFPERSGKSRGKAAWHRLEWLNGDSKGDTIDIRPKSQDAEFCIGLDPASDVCLQDIRVSRRHAALTLRPNGSCWVKDLGSRNGTFVNGERLHDKERLLRDGDKLTIAYFDFKFLDKNVKHDRFYLWMKLTAVIGALAVVAVLWVMWATARATVEDHMRLARRYAQFEKFDMARDALTSARMARDADKFIVQIDSLESNLERWRKTRVKWDKAKEALSKSRFGEARRLLDELNTGVMDDWAWSPEAASAEKRAAEFAATALRHYNDATDALSDSRSGQPELQADRIAERLAPLGEFISSSTGAVSRAEYLAPLFKGLGNRRTALTDALAGFRKVDECINALDADKPDFDGLVGVLQGMAFDETLNAGVRGYARKYAAPCRELAAAQSFVQQEFDSIVRMSFRDVMELRDLLRLPDKTLCARHPRLSEHRGKILSSHDIAQNYAQTLEDMTAALKRDVFAPRSAGAEALERVLSEATWAKVVEFDCLTRQIPSARRRDSAGFYDDTVGIEYVIESLKAMPNKYGGRCLSLVGFVPKLCTARDSLERISAFVEYMDSRRAWLREGKLGEFLAKCRETLKRRDAIVRSLRRRNGTERERLVLRFAAVYLSGKDEHNERVAIAADYKKLQSRLRRMCDDYNSLTNPADMIRERDRIISEGLPGDITRPKWFQKFDGGVQ